MKMLDTVIKITVCCPNCGSTAERQTFPAERLSRTQCPSCDYLMVTCTATGNVIEAYAPGIPVQSV